jgi:hypothetical protein
MLYNEEKYYNNKDYIYNLCMTSHSLIQQPDFRNNSGLDKFNVIYVREVLFRFKFEQCEMGIFLSIIHIKTLVQTFVFPVASYWQPVTLRSFENATYQLANKNNVGSVSTPLWTFISETLRLKVSSSFAYFKDILCLHLVRTHQSCGKVGYSMISFRFSSAAADRRFLLEGS